MATNASPFVVNIVDLQNIANSITGAPSGSAGLSQVQLDVANIQQMVNYETKTIAADVLSNFTSARDIQVQANLNFDNTSIYFNSNRVTFNTSDSSIPTTNSVNTNTYINTSDTTSSINFIVAGQTPLELTSTGNLQFTSSPTYFSTGVDITGFLYVSESAFVKNLYQTSDRRRKKCVEPFFTTVNDVLKLTPRKFEWACVGEADLGFIAQEVQEVWPILVEGDESGTLGLAYSRFIPLLLESIRELNDRVTALEKKA
jgi:hypothetical protein